MNANEFAIEVVGCLSEGKLFKGFLTTIELPIPFKEKYQSTDFVSHVVAHKGEIIDYEIEKEFINCPGASEMIKKLIKSGVESFEFYHPYSFSLYINEKQKWDESVDTIVKDWMNSLVINVLVEDYDQPDESIRLQFDRNLTEGYEVDTFFHRGSDVPKRGKDLSHWKNVNEAIKEILKIRGITFELIRTQMAQGPTNDPRFNKSWFTIGKGKLFDWDDIYPDIEVILKKYLGPNIHFSYKK